MFGKKKAREVDQGKREIKEREGEGEEERQREKGGTDGG
jgi:hypothetical protein